jgi:putative transposase
MPRRARVLIEGGVYHVYNRVASGEPVFADPEEAIRFIDLIRKVKARDGWTVFAYCVMSNHYHIAIRTSAVPLSRGMHHLQCEFSRGFNRRSGRTGGLWQSRYQAKLVDEQRYLTQLVLYIHLNPVRAGAVENPTDYVFAGHREIVKRVKDPLLDVDDSLLCFGDTARTARRAYLSAVRVGCKAVGDPGGAVADGLRSLVWRDRELKQKPDQEYVDILGRSTGLERPMMPTEHFVQEVCRLLGVEPARLASRVRDGSTAEMRRMVTTLGVERWSQKGRDIAAILGKNPDVVSYWVGQGVRRRLEDPDFARRLDALDRELAESAPGSGSSAGNR